MVFKNIFSDKRAGKAGLVADLALTLLIISTTGCRTLFPPLPAANLKQPGWTIHEGQAVWHVPGRTEIAGDVIVATHGDTRSLIQFSKPPFPLLTAQTRGNRWEIEFPPQKKRYAGRGEPPKRLLWLYLPRVLSGKPPPENWVWQENAKGWRLENGVTREWIEGYFAQPQSEGGT